MPASSKNFTVPRGAINPNRRKREWTIRQIGSELELIVGLVGFEGGLAYLFAVLILCLFHVAVEGFGQHFFCQGHLVADIDVEAPCQDEYFG